MEISEIDFKRFKKCVLHGPPFQFMLAGVADSVTREHCIARIDQVARDEGTLSASAIARLQVSAGTHPLVPRLVTDLQSLNQAGAKVIHVIPEQDWLTQAMASALNIYREGIFHSVTGRLVLWLTEPEIKCLATYAPDLWSWRSGPYRMYVDDDPL
jgi:hypothetical protein